MAVYVQTKVRLKLSTNVLIKKYQELNDITQSKIIEKALSNLFAEDQEFVDHAGMDVSNTHWNLTVAEIEEIIFVKYKIMIYIKAKQDEKFGIDLTPWPKCMSKYTVKQFKDKIIRRCLAKDIIVYIFDHNAEVCNQGKQIGTIKNDYKANNINLSDIQDYYDLWNDFDDNIEEN